MSAADDKVTPPLRVAHLASYLRELINDVAAQGKVAKIEGDPIQVAAVALMSGSIAVAGTLMDDVKLLAGDAKNRARVAARPMLEGLLVRGAGALLDRILPPAKR